MRILIACEYSGSVRDAFIRGGARRNVMRPTADRRAGATLPGGM
jgi:hypothetical protein